MQFAFAFKIFLRYECIGGPQYYKADASKIISPVQQHIIP